MQPSVKNHAEEKFKVWKTSQSLVEAKSLEDSLVKVIVKYGILYPSMTTTEQ